MDYAFVPKEPGKGYVTNNLVLPKKLVSVDRIKSALTFQLGEEPKINKETGEIVGIASSYLNLWEENKHHIIIPREFIPKDHYHEFNFEFVDLKMEDRDYETIKIRDSISFRDDSQKEAFDALVSHTGGTLNLSCGKGKTILALKLASTLQIPTIIVVNTTALLEQWKEEISRHLQVSSVGTVQGPLCDWKHPIVLSMIHTLSNRKEQWPMSFRRYFGLAIYEECHHVAAPIFSRSADLFFGRRYSLTATASRLDGLERIYQYHLGRVIYSDLSQDLIPSTVFHRLKWEFDSRYKALVTDTFGDLNLPRIRAYLGSLEWRNKIICADLLKDIHDGRHVLVLSHSVEHVENMVHVCQESGLPLADSITGSTPQSNRMNILRTANPVLGTFQLAREGLNRPDLDTLYVTTPFSSPNDLQQAWGRIQRVHPGKKDPLVRVYEDTAFNCCIGSCRQLRNYLNKMSYPFRKRDITLEET
jgi:superfamily II DNA or RNA helicase